jgi:hypothetical protein
MDSCNPRCLEDPKSDPEQAVGGTNQQALKKAVWKTMKLANACLQEGGGNF